MLGRAGDAVATAWLQSDQVLLDSAGNVLLCDWCPCDTGTGTIEPPAICECLHPAPSTIYCTLSGSVCSCVDGITFTMTYRGTTTDSNLIFPYSHYWEGEVVLSGATGTGADCLPASGDHPLTLRVRFYIGVGYETSCFGECYAELTHYTDADTGTGTAGFTGTGTGTDTGATAETVCFSNYGLLGGLVCEPFSSGFEVRQVGPGVGLYGCIVGCLNINVIMTE